MLNNQTALLKVVENFVYFNVKADTTSTVNVGTTVAVTTTPQSVSVGLVMTVTPQISSGDGVILNVRPTISSISELKEDPNPSIPAGVKNYVPQIRTREIESVMRVNSGEVAVLGGLMEDGVNWKTGRVPILGQIPLVGELFNTRNNAANKSELVIFLRPVIIKDPSLNGDFAGIPRATSRRELLQPDTRSATLEQSPRALRGRDEPFDGRPETGRNKQAGSPARGGGCGRARGDTGERRQSEPRTAGRISAGWQVAARSCRPYRCARCRTVHHAAAARRPGAPRRRPRNRSSRSNWNRRRDREEEKQAAARNAFAAKLSEKPSRRPMWLALGTLGLAAAGIGTLRLFPVAIDGRQYAGARRIATRPRLPSARHRCRLPFPARRTADASAGKRRFAPVAGVNRNRSGCRPRLPRSSPERHEARPDPSRRWRRRSPAPPFRFA